MRAKVALRGIAARAGQPRPATSPFERALRETVRVRPEPAPGSRRARLRIAAPQVQLVPIPTSCDGERTRRRMRRRHRVPAERLGPSLALSLARGTVAEVTRPLRQLPPGKSATLGS